MAFVTPLIDCGTGAVVGPGQSGHLGAACGQSLQVSREHGPQRDAWLSVADSAARTAWCPQDEAQL